MLTNLEDAYLNFAMQNDENSFNNDPIVFPPQ